jgi:hypothetical protein
MKNRQYPFVILVFCLFILCSFQSSTTKLARNSWSDSAYQSLTALLANEGSSSSQYDKNNKPYAVFDFDNTTAINDAEETLQEYQLEHLCYKILPNDMFSVLTCNVPDLDKPLVDFNSSLNGRKVTTRMLANDVARDYAYLYSHYVGLKGKQSLGQIRKTNQFLDFRCKVRFLYDALTETFSPDVSYSWILFFFKNMTPNEVRALTHKSVDYWMKTPLKKVSYESPSMGQGGKVKVTFTTGFAISKEMKDLYRCLRANGIDVFICSASLKEIIEAIATDPKYGLGLDRNHVIGMMLAKDKSGRFLNRYDTDYPMTFAEGKVTAIRNMIASKRGGKGPILVGGDSDGDFNMLTEFADMKCGLVINRHSKACISELYKKAEEKNSRYVLQGRDDTKGIFIPQTTSILLH